MPLRYAFYALLAALAVLLALIFLPRPARSAPGCPDITPDEARQILSSQGYGVGTVKMVGGLGRLAIAGLEIGTQGRWIVIKILPRTLDRRNFCAPAPEVWNSRVRDKTDPLQIR